MSSSETDRHNKCDGQSDVQTDQGEEIPIILCRLLYKGDAKTTPNTTKKAQAALALHCSPKKKVVFFSPNTF